MSKARYSKNLSQKTNRRALIIRILCATYAAIFLLTIGCTQNKPGSPLEPTLTQTDVQQSTNTVEKTINTLTPVPSVSPNASNYKTPEATNKVVKSNYFVFSPTEEELSELGIAAEEYYKRLCGNDNPTFSIGLAEYTVLDIVKMYCGDFDILQASIEDSNKLAKCKEECLWRLHNHVNCYLVNIGISTDLMSHNEFDGIFFQNPETYTLFGIGGFENYPGVSTLKLVEEILLKIYNSMKQKNIDLVTKNTQDLSIIAEMIFINNGGVYKDTEVTAFSKMYPTIKLLISGQIQTTLNDVLVFLDAAGRDGSDIKANVSSNYSVGGIVLKIEQQLVVYSVDKEILALMDAYIEAVKRGEITLS